MTTSDIPADVRALVEQSLKQFAYHYTYVAQNHLVETTRAAKHARSVAMHAVVADRRTRPDRAEVLLAELLTCVHQPPQKAGSTYWHVTNGRHVRFGEIMSELAALSREPPLNTSAEPVSKAAKIEHEPDVGMADLQSCLDNMMNAGRSSPDWDMAIDAAVIVLLKNAIGTAASKPDPRND